MTGRHLLRATLAGLLLAQVQAVQAGLFTTDLSVGNFHFSGTTLDYHPDPQSVRASNPILGPDGVFDGEGPLHIDAGLDNFGNLNRLRFTLFGSLPQLASLSEVDLLKGTVKALQPDNKGTGAVAFLAERDTVTGSVTNQYRKAGIFVLVEGVDEVDWINGYQDAAAIAKLLDLEDRAPADAPQGQAPPVPLPGTLMLLFGGLPLLLRHRRRSGN